MTEQYILILGSKPDSMFPDIKVKKIYSANGAAERALDYKLRYPNVPHVALISSREFEENDKVKNRVIKSKPDRIYCSSGSVLIPNELKDTHYETLSIQERFYFQSKFYKMKSMDIYFGELLYEKKIFDKIKHIYRCISYKGFDGVTTGLYSIMLAAVENPEAKIIVSGIGLVEGGHFYEKDAYGYISKRQVELIKKGKKIHGNKYRNTARCRVERFLVGRFKNTFKKNILTVDDSMVKYGSIKKWEGGVF